MRLLAISGSVRQGSYNAALLRAAAGEYQGDVEFVFWQGLADLPAYDEDLDRLPAPRPVEALRHEIGEADAVLIATPEYNGSIPGALKNALDWVSRPFPGNVLRGKPVAVVGASVGLFGALGAQAELRKVLGVIGAEVLDAALHVPRVHEAFTADGRLRDPQLGSALCSIVDGLTHERIDRAA
jgi:chromate reductase, NAD(P)H dehydrogenase (quinone)